MIELCLLSLNDYIAPHLQNDVDAILDCYRNLLRRNQLEEAAFVWLALDDVKVPAEKRQEQAEKLIPFLEAAKDIYFTPKSKSINDSLRTRLNLLIPKFSYGACEYLAKFPNHAQANQHVASKLRKTFPGNKISVTKISNRFIRTSVSFKEVVSSSHIKELLNPYLDYYSQNSKSPEIFGKLNQETYKHRDIYYVPRIRSFFVYFDSVPTSGFEFPEAEKTTPERNEGRQRWI